MAFAINPYFIDLDTLRDEGLLEKEEYGTIDWGESPEAVDYGALYEGRFAVLRRAYERFQVWLPDDYYTFCFWNEDWLEDYALYMTAKGLNKMKAYPEWPAPLRTRQPRRWSSCARKTQKSWASGAFCSIRATASG